MERLLLISSLFQDIFVYDQLFFLLLPAGEFGGQLGEQVGGRAAARVWQRAGIVG